MLNLPKHNSFLLALKLKKRAGQPRQIFDKALLARSLLPGRGCRHRKPHLDDPNGHGHDDQHMYQCHKRKYRKKVHGFILTRTSRMAYNGNPVLRGTKKR